MAGLALLCTCFPSDGLPLGWGLRLRLPSLTEVMGGAAESEAEVVAEEADTLPDLTPEELLQLRQDELNAQQMEEFRSYQTSNAARIYMPNEDETYLDALWETLQLASTRHVRIMHYGDSQIECDRITSLLRQRFQEEFGGMGVGLVPALQSIPTFTLSSSIWPEDVPQYLAYGPADMRSADNFYGPLARVTHIPERATIRLTGIGGKDYRRSSSFSRITVITRRKHRRCRSAAEVSLASTQRRWTEPLGASRWTWRARRTSSAYSWTERRASAWTTYRCAAVRAET